MEDRRTLRQAAPFETPLLRRALDLAAKAKEAEPLEFEHTLIRLGVGAVVTAYLIAACAAGAVAGGAGIAIASVLAAAWAVGIAGFVHLVRATRKRIVRRSVIIAADAAVLGLILGLAGRAGAMLAPLYLWGTLGNGFLFGPRYMYGAMAANLASFAAVALAAPFWREAWPFSLGLAAAIVAIPLYVSRLMGNFREVMIAAEAASRAKTEFISMISHELRTPLNAILGLAQLSKMTATSSKERLSAVSTELAAGRLLRMLDTILKFQRIESGTAERIDRDFDPLDILNEVRAVIEPLALQKGLHCRTRFTSSLPPRLRSDPDHIQTIVLNLMANAVKYTRHGKVSLEFGLHGSAVEPKLRIAVRDTGDGIAPELQSRIFERFVRGDQQSVAGEPGVGLGLSMCKSLVELHRGAIGCVSKPGEGALFWVEMPVAKAAGEGEQAAAPALAPVAWIGPPQPPAALAGIAAKTIGAAEIERCAGGADRSGLAPYVLAADPASLSSELRTALTRCLDSEPPPSLVLVGSRAGARDELDEMATAAACGLSDAEVLARVETAARWQARVAPAAEEEGEGAPAAAPAAAGPLSVLVADDNALNRDVTRRMLEIDGHKVTLAENGDDALRVLLDGEVEIALLDISMPGMSGIDVCNNYRACLGGARPIPIIGVTAALYDELRENCLDAGMADVLGRPVSIEQLRAALARYRAADAPAAGPVTPAADPAAEDDPIADTQRVQLLRDLFGEEKLHAQFLPSFRRDLGVGIDRLRDGMRKRSPQLIRDAIHAIKSSASTAGAREVLALAMGFQPGADGSDIDGFEAGINAAYRRYCGHLDGHRPGASAPKRLIAGL